MKKPTKAPPLDFVPDGLKDDAGTTTPPEQLLEKVVEGRGRRRVVFDEGHISIVRNLAHILNESEMAEFFGIGRTTFRNVMERQPEVERAFKQGRGKGIATAGLKLFEQVKEGKISAIIFYLKAFAGRTDRPEILESRRMQVEVSGPDGGPIQHQHDHVHEARLKIAQELKHLGKLDDDSPVLEAIVVDDEDDSDGDPGQ